LPSNKNNKPKMITTINIMIKTNATKQKVKCAPHESVMMPAII